MAIFLRRDVAKSSSSQPFEFQVPAKSNFLSYPKNIKVLHKDCLQT
jgi:hypothetical protein